MKNKTKDIVVSVPSGNFGNICAGLLAKKLGLPIFHFIASTNVNNTVPQYLETAEYQPSQSKQTISNAMDVGDPSNFIRIQELFSNNFDALKDTLSAYSFTDDATKEKVEELKNKYKQKKIRISLSQSQKF